ncbi:hypothetical protein [Streptomyces mesophilus]|uniref:hypothetical protein n=1 Tax=Streptomyces mesophilus TaxID=1775132 RepID=UPI003332FB51
MRIRALIIVAGALAATVLPTLPAFATPAPALTDGAATTHISPREEIQPAANIVGRIAHRGAERVTGKPIGLVPEQAASLPALKAPRHPVDPCP